MQLKHASFRNFRSLRDVSIEFGAHTAFIGGNGAGKSSVLKALEKFYATTKSLDVDDYFGRDQALSVEIELTFGDLTDEEMATFEGRVLLLRASDPAADHQAAPSATVVAQKYAHFQRDLEATLREELTPAAYDAALAAACLEFGVPVGKNAQKSPELMTRLLDIARVNGHSSATLRSAIRAIWRELKGVQL